MVKRLRLTDEAQTAMFPLGIPFGQIIGGLDAWILDLRPPYILYCQWLFVGYLATLTTATLPNNLWYNRSIKILILINDWC